ncbi:MAG TPA: hypothetical protein VJZ71_17955 [Phycisphaerae bacterium]|nr:hypothetical protein [Phycisphaerae bacterium]
MISGVPQFEVLPGLPPYGPLAQPFSASGQGTQCEGFVVRFFPIEGDPWVGNFQPGLTSFRTAEAHPDGRRVIVISGGQGYVVDPNDRKAVDYLEAWYVYAVRVGELLILATPVDLEAIGPEGRRWKTPEISVDGLVELKVKADHQAITGLAYSPVVDIDADDDWVEFEVEIQSGAVKGGAFGAL